MHVLRQLHRTLRPDGVLIDIHPQPEDPRVEILHSDRSVAVGAIDWTEDKKEIRAARKRLASVSREGLFHLERRRIFVFRAYHDSVDAWLAYRRERGATNVVPRDALDAARRELRSSPGQLVVVERVRASAYRVASEAS